jgi:hypothetical protein
MVAAGAPVASSRRSAGPLGRSFPTWAAVEVSMDLNSLLNYAQTLAVLYAWTLVAAGAFAIGETVARRAFSRRASSSSRDHSAH